MTNDLVRKMLALTAAVGADGGDGVVRALATLLAHMVHFDDGELVLSLATDLHRRPLTGRDGSVANEDVLARLQSGGAPFRVDDLREAEDLPKTRELLMQRRLRSLLAVPMSPWGGVRGAVVLVARAPCAFAGVSLNVLGPIVGTAGLALHQALRLSGLHAEIERLRQDLHKLREAGAAIADFELAATQKRLDLEPLKADLAAARRQLEERDAAITRLTEELRVQREGGAAASPSASESAERRPENEDLRRESQEPRQPLAQTQTETPSGPRGAALQADPAARPAAPGASPGSEAVSPEAPAGLHRHGRRRRRG
jgi:hypothetical protein